MPVLIVVLATDHPTEDAWVIECASGEADRASIPLPPYQGTGTMPNGAEVHLYGDPHVADRARIEWAEQARAMQDG